MNRRFIWLSLTALTACCLAVLWPVALVSATGNSASPHAPSPVPSGSASPVATPTDLPGYAYPIPDRQTHLYDESHVLRPETVAQAGYDFAGSPNSGVFVVVMRVHGEVSQAMTADYFHGQVCADQADLTYKWQGLHGFPLGTDYHLIEIGTSGTAWTCIHGDINRITDVDAYVLSISHPLASATPVQPLKPVSSQSESSVPPGLLVALGSIVVAIGGMGFTRLMAAGRSDMEPGRAPEEDVWRAAGRPIRKSTERAVYRAPVYGAPSVGAPPPGWPPAGSHPTTRPTNYPSASTSPAVSAPAARPAQAPGASSVWSPAPTPAAPTPPTNWAPAPTWRPAPSWAPTPAPNPSSPWAGQSAMPQAAMPPSNLEAMQASLAASLTRLARIGVIALELGPDGTPCGIRLLDPAGQTPLSTADDSTLLWRLRAATDGRGLVRPQSLETLADFIAPRSYVPGQTASRGPRTFADWWLPILRETARQLG